MKEVLIATVFILILTSCNENNTISKSDGLVQETVDWRNDWFKFRDDQKGFEILFSNDNIRFDSALIFTGEEIQRNYVYYNEPKSGTNSNMAYAVKISFINEPVSSALSDTSLSKDVREKNQQIVIDEYVNESSSRGELISKAIITYKNKYPGMVVKTNFKNGAYEIRNRIYLVGDKVYNLEVITSKENLYNKQIRRFLDSFRLIE